MADIQDRVRAYIEPVEGEKAMSARSRATVATTFTSLADHADLLALINTHAMRTGAQTRQRETTVHAAACIRPR